MMIRSIIAFGFALTVMGQAACSSSDAGGDGAGLPATYGETACVKCVKGTCSADLAQCDADASCKAYFDCVFACPPKNDHEVDGPCEAQCPEPASSPAANAAGACFKSQLEDSSSECAAACGG